MTEHLVIVGHGLNRDGSTDPGAIGNGYREWDLNKEVARNIQKWAKRGGETIDVYDVHNVYDYRDFLEVVSGYDTVTEVHFNSYNRTAHGTEVLIYEGYEPDDMDKRLLNALAQFFHNRGFSKRPYNGDRRIHHISVSHDNNVNYRLVEVCFIDNADDVKIYQARKEEIAKALAEALLGKELPEADKETGGRIYRVQVGAFQNHANAVRLMEELQKKGFKNVIIK